MDTKDFDELAGRIDGIGHAVLRLAAALEIRQLIDGPRVSALWRQAAHLRPDDEAVHRKAHMTLLQMAQMLDDARSSRQSAGYR